MTHTIKLAVISCLALLISLPSQAQQERRYQVTITNVTSGIQFTPILVATHNEAVRPFTVGQPALPELAVMAEGGDIAPLTELALSTGVVTDTANSAEVLDAPPLLFPGQTVTLELIATGEAWHLSLVAMMLPTNDSFVALNTVRLPRRGAVVHNALAYDAGTEPNDEVCANIPGPRCGGEGASPEVDGEGYVHISGGIHGIADLSAAVYDWRNPVARVEIRRMR